MIGRFLVRGLLKTVFSVVGWKSIRSEGHQPYHYLEHQDGFYRFDKTKLPLDYLQSGETILILDVEEHVVGGVTLHEGPRATFRTVQLCPFRYYPAPRAREMNGLWIHPDVSEMDRLRFWGRVLYVLLGLQNRTGVYFSYETKKIGLAKFYHSFTDQVIHSGYVKCLPGMDPNKIYEEEICMFWADSMVWKTFKLFFNRIVLK